MLTPDSCQQHKATACPASPNPGLGMYVYPMMEGPASAGHLATRSEAIRMNSPRTVSACRFHPACASQTASSSISRRDNGLAETAEPNHLSRLGVVSSLQQSMCALWVNPDDTLDHTRIRLLFTCTVGPNLAFVIGASLSSLLSQPSCCICSSPA